MNVKMTPGQANTVAFFAELEQPYGVRTNQATYATCRKRGWIERIEAFPYHRTTDAGLEALKGHMAQVARK
jgi:hypothetical protein